MWSKKVSVSVSKNLVSKKVSVPVSKTFGLEKSLGLGLENIWSRKKVSVSVSKKLVLKKVSVSVSKTFGLEKSLGLGLENIWSRKKVSVSVSKILVSQKSLGIRLDEIFWSRHSVISISSWRGRLCCYGSTYFDPFFEILFISYFLQMFCMKYGSILTTPKQENINISSISISQPGQQIVSN